MAVAHKGHCTTEKQKSDDAWCWSLTSTAKHTACASNARLIMAAMMALALVPGVILIPLRIATRLSMIKSKSIVEK